MEYIYYRVYLAYQRKAAPLYYLVIIYGYSLCINTFSYCNVHHRITKIHNLVTVSMYLLFICFLYYYTLLENIF